MGISSPTTPAASYRGNPSGVSDDERAHPEECRWPNSRLVQECLAGNEDAWVALILKYKNLIYSIPRQYGLSREQADDIFQSVCLCLLYELQNLKDPQALPAWLIRVSYRKCALLAREHRRYTEAGAVGEESPSPEASPEVPLEILKRTEHNQIMREALAALSPRCRRMIHLLFFEDPPRPYREVAESLRLATGSIGFVRARCLQGLRTRLEKAGLNW